MSRRGKAPGPPISDVPFRSDSAYFAGKYINIQAVARTQGVSVSHISRVLKGVDPPSVQTGIKIAAALGLGLEEMLTAIANRRAQIAAHRGEKLETDIRAYRRRVREEDEEDDRRRKAGLPVIPRLPALRLPPGAKIPKVPKRR